MWLRAQPTTLIFRELMFGTNEMLVSAWVITSFTV
jgi:hypothetical protein